MKEYAKNKHGLWNYEILEEFEGGLVLTGAEVKSIRNGKANLRESFGTVKNNEIWLTNTHISPYLPANNQDYEPTRSRKILLSRREIDRIIGKVQEKGITLVPVRIYDKNGKIKIQLGLGRGKKKHDKREVLRRRDTDREIKREIKNKLS